MIPGLVLFVAALILRAVSPNRHVRGRLMASGIAFAAYAVLGAAINYHVLSAGMQQQIAMIQPLLVVFGLVNGLVAIVVNPWRVDRLPDRFPTIVQDAMVIGLFAIGATMILQEKIFATTAVGAVVIGFALQDTLGNLFSGLAIQVEKPFRVGHWVRIADIDGLVSEITWRAVKVRTKAGNFVVVPNSKLADDIIINYSEPTPETRIEVTVGVSYDNTPDQVKQTIVDALKDHRGIHGVRPPEVLLDDFDDFTVNYTIRAWITQFDADEHIKDHIRSSLYYAFRRNGIVIPYPIGTEIQKEDLPPPPRDYSHDEQTLAGVAVFASLSAAERAQLARATIRALFARGEFIVRQGESGTSMFIVAAGEAVVTIEPEGREVARIGPGGFFGEMSLLTGAPRNATVRTARESELLEIRSDAFRRFVLANPEAVDQIGAAVADRRAELEERRAEGPGAASPEPPHTLIDRIRRYLHLNL
jgi:small-conductance mechanosensitive channel/CRP-like cAMP-binding protein